MVRKNNKDKVEEKAAQQSEVRRKSGRNSTSNNNNNNNNGGQDEQQGEDCDVDLLEPGYLNGSVQAGELVRRLKVVFGVLSVAEQDEDHSHLISLAAGLSSPAVMGHKDKAVRSYAACCLADMLRLCAPEVPFTDAVLQDVFALFMEQLKGLGAVGTEPYTRTFYLLERLATVKAFIILCGLDDPVESLVGLFHGLLESLTKDHGAKERTYISQIMQCVLEELEDTPQPVLDELFTWVLPPVKTDRPHAYSLVKEVLVASTEHIQRAVSSFLNGVLISGATRGSDLADKAQDIIYELYVVSPTLLLFVMPNLAMDLKASDGQTRLTTTKLLCRLVEARGPQLGAEYRDLFVTLLSRFGDADVAVRVHMVDHALAILKADPSAAPEIREAFAQRVVDPDEKVRFNAIKAVCDSAAMPEAPLATAELLEAVAGRVRDRKLAIRLATLSGLVTAYRSAQARLGRDVARWRGDDRARFASIPQRILTLYPTNLEIDAKARLWMELRRCLAAAPGVSSSSSSSSSSSAANQSSDRMDVDGGGDDDVGDGDNDGPDDHNVTASFSATSAQVADGILSLYANLNGAARTTFLKVVEAGSIIRVGMVRLLEARKAAREQGTASAKEELAASVTHLATHLVNPAKAKDVVTKIVEAKEVFVGKHLAALVSPALTTEERVKMTAELVRKFEAAGGGGGGNNSARYLLACISHHPFDSAFVERALEKALDLAQAGSHVPAAEILALLEGLAKHSPQAFAPHVAVVRDLAADGASEAVLVSSLRILTHVGSLVDSSNQAVAKSLKVDLPELCVATASPRVAKWATRALSAVIGETGSLTVLTKLRDRLGAGIVEAASPSAVPATRAAVTYAAFGALVASRPVLFLGISEESSLAMATAVITRVGKEGKEGKDAAAAAAAGGAAGKKRAGGAGGDLGSGAKDSDLCSRDAEMRARGIKLVGTILTLRVTGQDVDSAQTQHLLRADPLAPKVAGLLSALLAEAAPRPGAAPIDYRRVTLSALGTELRLLSAHGWDEFISPKDYFSLVRMAANDDVQIRRTLAERLVKSRAAFRSRFLPLLAFYALDDNKDLAAYARQALAHAVKGARQLAARAGSGSTGSAVAAAAEATSSAAADGATLASLRSFNVLPENGLSHLIHTLAHHDMLEGDGPVYRQVTRVLGTFLDVVLSGSDSFAFLTQLAAAVRTADDVLAATSRNLVLVADMALFLIKKRSESRSWKMQDFPGPILLPVTLFRTGTSARPAKSALTEQFIKENSKRDRVDNLIDSAAGAATGGQQQQQLPGSPAKRNSAGGAQGGARKAQRTSGASDTSAKRKSGGGGGGGGGGGARRRRSNKNGSDSDDDDDGDDESSESETKSHEVLPVQRKRQAPVAAAAEPENTTTKPVKDESPAVRKALADRNSNNSGRPQRSTRARN